MEADCNQAVVSQVPGAQPVQGQLLSFLRPQQARPGVRRRWYCRPLSPRTINSEIQPRSQSSGRAC